MALFNPGTRRTRSMLLQFRLRRQNAAFVPTTSMADIAFLLIIFFMVTAEFSVRKGLHFAMAAEATEAGPVQADPVVLELDAGGRLRIDDAAANLDDIKRALTPRLEASPNQWVIIRSDGDTPYGSVIEVLDQLKQIGIRNIALPTRQEFAAWQKP